MDHILFWNARGAGSDDFRSAISDLVRMNTIDFLFICEPKVQFAQFKKHYKKLGFNDFEVIEANGFSGGLWTIWNDTKFSVSVFDSTSRSISLQISGNGTTWMLTCLYASPCKTSRQELWDYLTALHAVHQLPWLVIGDFNEIIAYEDKNGGPYTGKFGGLRSWVHNDAMLDLGFQGAVFTWSNGKVKEILDRGFCNADWRLNFPEAKVVHLPRIRSDHCPVLVQLQPSLGAARTNPPFRFQAMWMQHKDYYAFVNEAWSKSTEPIEHKIASLASELTTWNKQVFGNILIIFKQKRRLLARIGGIQRSCCHNDNQSLRKLELKLIKQYEELRDSETMLWKQKSREKWIQEGDRNTKFFHLTTLVRRRRNKIDGLFDAHGSWSDSHVVMKGIAKDFFMDLFSFHERPDTRFIIPNLFPEVNCVELDQAVSPLEIKQALFAIGSLKAPGADGFPALFYHKHWNICNSEITQLITDIFTSGVIPRGLNHTLLTLVPKIQNPKYMQLFRPISLCCTLYKVVSKIIVSRLRPFLKHWISPNQVSFVPDMHISDNVMITQEILHKCRTSKGKNGFLV